MIETALDYYIPKLVALSPIALVKMNKSMILTIISLNTLTLMTC